MNNTKETKRYSIHNMDYEETCYLIDNNYKYHGISYNPRYTISCIELTTQEVLVLKLKFPKLEFEIRSDE